MPDQFQQPPSLSDLWFGPKPNQEQLDRIEAKLDRLLTLLDENKGLWVAPTPKEATGHYTGIKIGEKGAR